MFHKSLEPQVDMPQTLRLERSLGCRAADCPRAVWLPLRFCLLTLLGIVNFATLPPISHAAAPRSAVQEGQEVSQSTWDEQWFGVLEAGGAKLRLQVQVRKDAAGQWEGHVISLDQNKTKMPIESYQRTETELAFTLAAPAASFAGKLEENGRRVNGQWKQGGASFDLVFKKSSGLSKLELDSVWNGVLRAGGRELEMRVRVLRNPQGELTVELDSLTEGIEGIGGELEIDEQTIRLQFPNVRATYEGTLNEDSNQVTGDWKQAGQTFPLVFERAATNELPEEKLELKQVWIGELNAGLRKLTLQFRIVADEDGEQQVKLDSLDEGLRGLQGTIQKKDQQVTFSFSRIGAVFEGTFSEDQQQLDGKWKQSGIELPLKLERREQAQAADDQSSARPQTPQGPFPYEQIELTAENTTDQVTLAGTLCLPSGDGPFPAAILISGSGGQDRDETILGHKPFWVIADALARGGVAVLRFDDRGIGESTGEHDAATTRDFARDAAAWIDRLQELDQVKSDSIGFIGHSEGGLIAPLIAAEREDVAFCILLAGPGVTGEQIIYQQSRLIAQAAGVSDAELDEQEAFLRKCIAVVKKATPDESVKEKLTALVDEQIAQEQQRSQAEDSSTSDEADQAKQKSQSGETVADHASSFAESMDELPPETQRALATASIQRFDSPWFRFFLTYDPAPTLEKVSCPVLALIGEKDLQVPPEPNLEAIRSALVKSSSETHEVKMLPGLNHLFQHAETGSPAEYASIEETFDPATLQILIDWIKQVTN